MYLCYIDESGTPDVPGNTSHYVLAGISIPIWHWHAADREIAAILSHYGLAGEELHTAWILRSYLEQYRIPNFEQLTRDQRRNAVQRERNQELLKLQHAGKSKAYQQQKKTFAHTRAYIHLTRDERRQLIRDVADCVSRWGFARLFAECVDKIHFDPVRAQRSLDEQAFEQVVSRFEQYLSRTEGMTQRNYGILVHDNNQTVAKKHTELMRRFHRQGTLWTMIDRIIETPMFVDSGLTSMVQIADLCSYALRRYLENQEDDLFTRIMSRADRIMTTVAGVRHYTNAACICEVCRLHRN